MKKDYKEEKRNARMKALEVMNGLLEELFKDVMTVDEAKAKMKGLNMRWRKYCVDARKHDGLSLDSTRFATEVNRYIAINELVAMDGRLKAEWLNEMTIEGLGPMLTDVKKRDYVVRVQEKRVDFKRLEECRRQLEGCDVFDVFKARALRREIEEIRVKWAASSLNAQTKSASPLHPLPEGKGATGEKPEGPEIRMIN